jgi:hypothetical protein
MRMRGVASLAIIFLGLAGSAVADDVVDGRFGPGALYRSFSAVEWKPRTV